MSYIIEIIIIGINTLHSYLIGSSTYIDRMPPVTNSIFQQILNNYFSISVIKSLLSILVYLAINKFIINKEVKLIKYIVLFLILIFVNIIAYSLGVKIVY